MRIDLTVIIMIIVSHPITIRIVIIIQIIIISIIVGIHNFFLILIYSISHCIWKDTINY